MKEYKVQVTQNGKVVAGILLPMLLVIPLIVILFYLSKNNASDGIIVPVIILFILAFFATTWFTLRQFMFKGVVKLNADGFSLRFTNRNLFTPKDVDLKMADITNFWVDQQQGYRYMSFTTVIKPKAFNLMPYANSESDRTEYEGLLTAIAAMVEAYNNSDTDAPRAIEARTMYEEWWAKVLAVLLIVVMVITPLMYFLKPEASEAPVSKFFILLLFGLPFLYKVWQNNFGK